MAARTFRPAGGDPQATTAMGTGTTPPPQPEAEPEAPEAGAEASYSADSGEPEAGAEHFAQFDMDPDGEFGEPGADGGDGAGADAAQGIIPFEEWFKTVFVGLFQGGAAFTGLETLRAVTEDRRDAEGAARAIYDTACEVPSLRFLVQPGNKWVGRAFAVGMFALPLAGGVRQEVAAKKAARKAQAAESAQAKRERAQTTPGDTGQGKPENSPSSPQTDAESPSNVVDLDWVTATGSA